ncbi:tRNA (guanine-N(7)-)-methyltransferase non-catalytic subunit trm82 [Neonectria magnoliae]|uniref:tRNA (Guanine-N(7)-)-methyltransferase non-catalytic subunit trm82 n=1 Tax=Neonectria magnoliae TaxID=2732573 RepID=A0ABR1IBS2_9HYPO
MKIPYNVLHVSGNVLFAARGGKIHSFSLDDGTHLSTWKHLDVDKVNATVKTIADEVARKPPETSAPEAAEGGDGDEPPAKRQRVEEPKDDADKPAGEESAQASNAAEGSGEKNNKGKSNQKGKKSKNNQNNQSRKDAQISKVPDRPVITHLTSTGDGAHLLAITGHDKAIWIFEHDGKGQLTQLSRRTMPKRPSSVAIAPDSQIICADKFGDVYVLPLIETIPSPSTTQPSTPAPAASKPAVKLQANTKTVHSQRNLRALNNQQRQMELATRSKTDADSKAEAPDFELTQLLGHVSMLISLVLGESDGRRYILTADRDEHIRVSRYIPQAHVIEGFCFGHKEFVSAMTIPLYRGEVLISGGGDEDLFVWDWKSSRLLTKKSLLSLAQEIVPELAKVAVCGLETFVYPTETGDLTYVVAICEDIQAIFSWQLTDDNTLNHPSIIQLPGKPLDIAFKPAKDGEPPRIITAVDAGEQIHVKSLAIYSLIMTDEKLAVGTTTFVTDGDLEAEESDLSESVVRGLLYNTENLRKQPTDQGEEQSGEQQAA